MFRKFTTNLLDFTFLLPALLVFSFVILIPLIQAIPIAFTNWDGISKEYTYIGLKKSAHFVQ